jgi:hypothetical protein
VTGISEYPITLTSSGDRDRHLCRANYNCRSVARSVVGLIDPVSGIPDWYLTDHIGSVRAIVRDAGGYVKSLELSFHVAADIDPPYAGDYGNSLEVLDEITYDSFGNVSNETNPAASDRFRFTARELDAALNLYY